MQKNYVAKRLREIIFSLTLPADNALVQQMFRQIEQMVRKLHRLTESVHSATVSQLPRVRCPPVNQEQVRATPSGTRLAPRIAHQQARAKTGNAFGISEVGKASGEHVRYDRQTRRTCG
jgi:hypothetical protein